jgi:bacterioferritin-associated ferredoxin
MYVCICNAIRESDLRAAVRANRSGAGRSGACRSGASVEALYASLGRTPQCRQCRDEAEDVIADELVCAGMSMAAAA